MLWKEGVERFRGRERLWNFVTMQRDRINCWVSSMNERESADHIYDTSGGFASGLYCLVMQCKRLCIYPHEVVHKRAGNRLQPWIASSREIRLNFGMHGWAFYRRTQQNSGVELCLKPVAVVTQKGSSSWCWERGSLLILECESTKSRIRVMESLEASEQYANFELDLRNDF